MLAPLHSCNNPGLWFSAFNCVKQWLPLSFSLSTIMLLGGGNSLYSNLTYIICNAIMLECMASLLSRPSSYTHILKLLQRFSRIQNTNFSCNTMDRSHTLKHIMFIQ